METQIASASIPKAMATHQISGLLLLKLVATWPPWCNVLSQALCTFGFLVGAAMLLLKALSTAQMLLRRCSRILRSGALSIVGQWIFSCCSHGIEEKIVKERGKAVYTIVHFLEFHLGSIAWYACIRFARTMGVECKATPTNQESKQGFASPSEKLKPKSPWVNIAKSYVTFSQAWQLAPAARFLMEMVVSA